MNTSMLVPVSLEDDDEAPPPLKLILPPAPPDDVDPPLTELADDKLRPSSFPLPLLLLFMMDPWLLTVPLLLPPLPLLAMFGEATALFETRRGLILDNPIA